LAGHQLQVGRECHGAEVRADTVLVHQRLAIIDMGLTGWQPMSTPDGRYHIVYNGEIYNYLELRRDLERLGHRFRSTSDTEVLLLAYASWGIAAFRRLVGMFALAVLDSQQRTLLLARDFFGIKPLYYARWRDGHAFASEIKALLDLPGVGRTINPHRLYAYLRHGTTDHGAGSLLREVRQLPAAHWLELPMDGQPLADPVRYWDLDLSARSDLSLPAAADQLRELFLESVRLHLRSDVPVGVALSGGIDSSSIALSVRHLTGPSQELHTFSYIADDPRLSEEHWVDLAGTAAGAVVHKVCPSVDDLAQDFERLVTAQDEPFGSTSIYAQFRVFQRAQQVGVKVMLDGQGADELLGGYRGYLAVRLASLLRQKRWAEASAFFRRASTWPESGRRWLAMSTVGHFVPTRLQPSARRLVGRDLLPDWLNARWFAERGVGVGTGLATSGTGELREALYRALSEANLPALLRYEDRNSMIFSIESRVPFLTPALADFLLSLPEAYLIDADGASKAVFRRAMRGIVPDAILDRREKVGFETSEWAWLTGLRPWVEQTLAGDQARRIPALSLDGMQRAWQSRLDGQHPVRSVDSPVWRWINLIAWSGRFDVAFD
jgi:asparagine synthase (glutamine-hydrolysing)